MESLRAENEAITKYQFNKEQIAVSLSLFISRSFTLFFPPPLSLRVKRMTCHYQSTPTLTAKVLVLYGQGGGWWLDTRIF